MTVCRPCADCVPAVCWPRADRVLRQAECDGEATCKYVVFSPVSASCGRGLGPLVMPPPRPPFLFAAADRDGPLLGLACARWRLFAHVEQRFSKRPLRGACAASRMGLVPRTTSGPVCSAAHANPATGLATVGGHPGSTLCRALSFTPRHTPCRALLFRRRASSLQVTPSRASCTAGTATMAPCK